MGQTHKGLVSFDHWMYAFVFFSISCIPYVFWAKIPTCFLCEIFKGGNALLAVVPLVGHGGDIRPAELSEDVNERLSLVGVGRDDSGEVAEPGLVTQFNTGRRVADLGNLKSYLMHK